MLARNLGKGIPMKANGVSFEHCLAASMQEGWRSFAPP
jgi:hypothetical protein